MSRIRGMAANHGAKVREQHLPISHTQILSGRKPRRRLVCLRCVWCTFPVSSVVHGVRACPSRISLFVFPCLSGTVCQHACAHTWLSPPRTQCTRISLQRRGFVQSLCDLDHRCLCEHVVAHGPRPDSCVMRRVSPPQSIAEDFHRSRLALLAVAFWQSLNSHPLQKMAAHEQTAELFRR